MYEWNYDIGFVILHYNVIESTIKCIESIMTNCHADKFAIIVVDNASPNKSGKQLQEKYKEIQNVFVLINEKNIGFSAGNNVGYTYAKHRLKCQFIVLMNNDIILLSNNLYEQAHADFLKYNYAVLGPRIWGYNNTKGTINPVLKDNYSKKRLLRERRDCLIYLLMSHLYLENLWKFFRQLITKIISCMLRLKKIYDTSYYEKTRINVSLHGCIWILSPFYIERFEGLETVTFMYHEEEILMYQLQQCGGITMYEPAIKVFHDHSLASNTTGKSTRESNIIRYKRALQSVNSVLEYIKD